MTYEGWGQRLPRQQSPGQAQSLKRHRRRPRSLMLLALLYVFSTPLDIVELPIGTPVTIAGGLFLVAWAFALMKGNVRLPRGGGAQLALGALVVWSFASVFWSFAPSVSLTSAITTMLLGLSAVALAGVFPGEPEQPALALGVGSAIASLAALVSGPDISLGLSDQATFLGIDQNILAFHISLGLAALLFLLFRHQPIRMLVLLLVLVALQCVALIRVGSRTGIGSVVALGVVFLVLSLRSPRGVAIGLLASVVVGLGIRWVSSAGLVPGRILDWLQNPVTTDRRSEIIDVYRITQPEWFISGVGAGADADYLSIVASWYKNAHSGFWKVWIELGLVGLMIWGLLLAALTLLAWRSRHLRFFVLAAVPILLFFYTLGPMNSNALWAIFGLALGANVSREADSRLFTKQGVVPAGASGG